MVDTLAFLSKDYKEEKAIKLCQKVAPKAEKTGAYSTELLRATKDFTITQVKEKYEEIMIEMRGKIEEEIYAKHGIDVNADDSTENISEELENQISNEINEAIDKYYKENDAYEHTSIRKGQYVLKSYMNVRGCVHLAKILKKMFVPFDLIFQWWGDEISQDCFEYIDARAPEDIKDNITVLLGDCKTPEELEEAKQLICRKVKKCGFDNKWGCNKFITTNDVQFNVNDKKVEVKKGQYFLYLVTYEYKCDIAGKKIEALNINNSTVLAHHIITNDEFECITNT